MKVVIEVIEFEKELQSIRNEISFLKKEIYSIREIINEKASNNTGAINSILQSNNSALQKLNDIETFIKRIDDYNKEPMINHIGRRIKEFVEDLRKSTT